MKTRPTRVVYADSMISLIWRCFWESVRYPRTVSIVERTAS